MKLGVAIVTYQGEQSIAACLTPLLQSALKPKVLVIDSSSTDQTVPIAKGFGVDVLVIPKEEFNHGLTREKARQILKCDIVAFLTQDAILAQPQALEKLIRPIVSGHASLTYARQLPHRGADFFESFHREFNYPNETQFRSFSDIKKYGVYTCFNSDSCAAYANSALDVIGGFPEVVFGEDTLVAAKLILQGHTIGYVAESEVRHSHRYTLRQEFCRHFDTGLYRKMHEELFRRFGSDKKRGWQYARLLLKSCKLKYFPYACAQLFIKRMGYFFGTKSVNAPIWLKKCFSSQPYYWK